jgi:hypothetical protein
VATGLISFRYHADFEPDFFFGLELGCADKIEREVPYTRLPERSVRDSIKFRFNVKFVEEAVRGHLSKDYIQRIIYALGLILWTLIAWGKVSASPYITSSFGVDYLTLYTLPALILIIQILRNNQLLWALIFALVTLAFGIVLYYVISDAIERSGDHVKSIEWGAADVIALIVLFSFLLIVDRTIYHIKPKRLI